MSLFNPSLPMSSSTHLDLHVALRSSPLATAHQLGSRDFEEGKRSWAELDTRGSELIMSVESKVQFKTTGYICLGNYCPKNIFLSSGNKETWP